MPFSTPEAINKNVTLFQEFIYLSRYSRFKHDEGRRETWNETVTRYFDFFKIHLKETCGYNFPTELRNELEGAVLRLNVMPSMRAVMTAGPALERSNLAGYNCSYLPIDRVTSFDETMFLLMNGCGVGFSVERQYINQLPTIADEFHHSDITISVADSKIGWCKSFKEIIHLLYGGQIPKWDMSKVRPAGSILKTFGGRASGPGVLDELFKFTVQLFRNAAGRKLTSLECHDLECKIGEVVVVGGVRRSAEISLSNLSDDRLRHAKSGDWWKTTPYRHLSNNSAVYTEKPEIGLFMREWLSLFESKSGERGIFNRDAARRKCEEIGRNPDFEWGVNPCGEIILRPRQMCNLSEVIIRPDDTEETLKEKVRVATILGTFQSTLTKFPYVSSQWQKNCEEERLLGVSLTGIMDNRLTNGKKSDLVNLLKTLRKVVKETNKTVATRLGINPSTAMTCLKPSGTVSQLTDTASGIHPRHSPYYIRTVRQDIKDPMTTLMVQQGVPAEPEINNPGSTVVFSFPMKSPDKSVTRKDLTAIEHLELCKTYREHWCDHNPSTTISIRDHEWLQVASWVYDNFDNLGGTAFLPYIDASYAQMPYQEITETEYKDWMKKVPVRVDWSLLKNYEKEDNTTGNQQLACGSPVACEV